MMAAEPAHTAKDGGASALPRLGRRGGGWVVAQVILLTAILLSALVRFSWPGSLEPAALAIGGLLALFGLGLLMGGTGALARVSAVTPFPAPRTGSELQTSGVYRLVRHPMYGGGILLALGWSIIFATVIGLALSVVLVVFADLKARREELWLTERFAGYDDYRRHTPRRLIPFVW